MAKLLVAVIAFCTLAYLGYAAMYKTKLATAEDQLAHAPKRQLDNVREKAKAMEAQDEQRLKDMERKSGE